MWWSQDNDFVEFFYANGEASFPEGGPTLHHLRSSNLKNEDEYLMKCWQECLRREIIIPAHLIRDEDEDGTVHRIYTDYLTGPLFEFPAQTEEPASVDSAMQDDSEQSTVASEKSVEDNCTRTNESPSSDALQEPSCDHEPVAFRLIEEEETISFEEDNLLDSPSATDKQQGAFSSGMMVVRTW